MDEKHFNREIKIKIIKIKMETNTPYYFVEIGNINVNNLTDKIYLFKSKHNEKGLSGRYTLAFFNATHILLSSSEMMEMGLEVPINKQLLFQDIRDILEDRNDWDQTSSNILNLFITTLANEI